MFLGKVAVSGVVLLLGVYGIEYLICYWYISMTIQNLQKRLCQLPLLLLFFLRSVKLPKSFNNGKIPTSKNVTGDTVSL